MLTHPATVLYDARHVNDFDARLLGVQRELVETWLASEAAIRTAERYLRWRGVDADPTDVCNEAWVRMQESLDRRDVPLPSVTSADAAAAYCARVIDNLVRDRRRSLTRQQVDPIDEFRELASHTGVSSEDRVLDRMMVEQLLHVVARLGAQHRSCDGCPQAVVVATALEVIHMVLGGDDGGTRGRDWMDQIIHAALARVDQTERTDRAWDKRKSRCGRCVVELLAEAMNELTGGGDER